MIHYPLLVPKAGYACALYFVISWLFFPTYSAQAAVELTPAENTWLEANPDIRIGLKLFPPYLSILDNNNQPAGLAIDYIEALEQQLGLRFTSVRRDTYGQLINLAKHRSIDILYAATPTPKRKEYLSFTAPYTFVENRIFVRQREFQNALMETFNGLRFAVSGKTALVEYIHNKHPEIQLVEAANLGEAFSWLGSGFVDGVGGNVSTAYAFMQKKGLANIDVGERVGFDFNVAFAISNDKPHLVSIINKAFDAIPLEQRKTIGERWLAPQDPNKIDRQIVKQWLYAGFFIAVVMLMWWTRSLKKQIAQRRLVEQKLSHLAYHDEITGALNRVGFLEQLNRLDSQGQSYVVLTIGIDHFHVKNDLLGQATGNEILKRLGNRLRESIVVGGIVARTGGDIFACMVPQQTDTPEKIASYFLEKINRPLIMSDGTTQSVTATLGVDSFTDLSLKSAIQYFEHAEVALNYGKRQPRGNYHFYHEQMNYEVDKDQEWKEALRDALDKQQLFLEYQPQLDLSNRRLLGFEALVRWQHPEKGSISPAEFIHHAERLGVIVDLGYWVMEEACEQAKNWLDQGLRFDRIAVNVSVYQFAENNFVERVGQILANSGLSAHNLELEITETLFLEEFHKVREVMKRLSDEGVHFAIDDFGTGFSSMLHLKKLPVRTIKIAQEFVLDISSDNGSYQIVRASTHLGKSLGMNVIAEGVEDSDTQRILLDLDCVWAQGYCYSKPVRAEMVTAQRCQQWIERIDDSKKDYAGVAIDDERILAH